MAAEIIDILFEVIGTIAFAVSGAMVAIEKKMDILGIVTMGTVTAVGGGIIRDICLGITPPTAFCHPFYTVIAVIVSLIMFYPAIGRVLLSRSRLFDTVLRLMDSIGLAIFAMAGIHLAYNMGCNNFTMLMVGVFTGVGGGVIRDVLSDTTPFIFVKQFYCSAVIIGSLLGIFLIPLTGEKAAHIVGALTILILRLLAAHYRWQLPKADF